MRRRTTTTQQHGDDKLPLLASSLLCRGRVAVDSFQQMRDVSEDGVRTLEWRLLHSTFCPAAVSCAAEHELTPGASSVRPVLHKTSTLSCFAVQTFKPRARR